MENSGAKLDVIVTELRKIKRFMSFVFFCGLLLSIGAFLSTQDSMFLETKNGGGAMTSRVVITQGNLSAIKFQDSELRFQPPSTGGTAEVKFYELAANGTNYVGLKAPDLIGTDKMWKLPAAEGGANQALKTDGGGNLGWMDVQPLDTTLTSFAAFNTNGLLTQTAADTFTGRTITGTANQVIVANGDGVSGNPTLSLPQSINSGASPNFAGMNLSGLTASQAVVTDASKNLSSLAYTSSNTVSTIVSRDGSGNFSAGTITASLTGAASLNVLKSGDTMSGSLTIGDGAGTDILSFNATSGYLTLPSVLGTTNGNIRYNAGVLEYYNGATRTVVDTNTSQTLTNKTWNGNTIGVGYGGTGTATTFTTGSVVFAGGSGAYTQDNAKLFWDDTNDRLGIGTVSPKATLDIAGGYATASLTTPAGLAIAAGGASPDRAQVIWGDNTGWKLHFGTKDGSGNFQSRVTMMDTGNVGIGNLSPGQKLDVTGNIRSSDQIVNNNFNWAAQTNTDPSTQGSLRFTTTHTGGGNLYTYHRITTAPYNYSIVANDYLEFDVYCSPSNPGGAAIAGIEIDNTDATAGRSLGITDQNGLTAFAGNKSSYASGRWYHVKAALTNLVGKTINYVSLVEESDTNGTYTSYYRRIIITNGSTIKATIWDGGAPTVNTLSYGSGTSNNDASGSYFSGTIAMGGNKITNLGTPTANADAATKAYVDAIGGAYQFYRTYGGNGATTGSWVTIVSQAGPGRLIGIRADNVTTSSTGTVRATVDGVVLGTGSTGPVMAGNSSVANTVNLLNYTWICNITSQAAGRVTQISANFGTGINGNVQFKHMRNVGGNTFQCIRSTVDIVISPGEATYTVDFPDVLVGDYFGYCLTSGTAYSYNATGGSGASYYNASNHTSGNLVYTSYANPVSLRVIGDMTLYFTSGNNWSSSQVGGLGFSFKNTLVVEVNSPTANGMYGDVLYEK